MFTVTPIVAYMLPAFVILLVVLGILAALKIFLTRSKEGEEESQPNLFEKKPFVFDAMTELALYRQLLELFGDKYYIFPQISYGRLVQLKKGVELRNRTRFDKKIADFVLCDKERAIAQLVIELDGSSHQSEKRIERDTRVDKMMQEIGLPIMHLKVGAFTNDTLKNEVLNKLSNVPLAK